MKMKFKRLGRFLVMICINLYVRLKWMLFWRYYDGLAVQAHFLYRQSWIYKERWQQMGYDYAQNSFESVAKHFFYKAQEEPFVIKWHIFCDAFWGREPRPYYIEKGS